MKPTLLLLPRLGADEALFRYQFDNLKDIADPVRRLSGLYDPDWNS